MSSATVVAVESLTVGDRVETAGKFRDVETVSADRSIGALVVTYRGGRVETFGVGTYVMALTR